jgi:hypothetical protein
VEGLRIAVAFVVLGTGHVDGVPVGRQPAGLTLNTRPAR